MFTELQLVTGARVTIVMPLPDVLNIMMQHTPEYLIRFRLPAKPLEQPQNIYIRNSAIITAGVA